MANVSIVSLDFRKTPRLYMNTDAGRLEVKSMVNTTRYKTGDLLSEKDVEDLIELGYRVTINSPTNKDYESTS